VRFVLYSELRLKLMDQYRIKSKIGGGSLAGGDRLCKLLSPFLGSRGGGGGVARTNVIMML
jgi:hypothetical protein